MSVGVYMAAQKRISAEELKLLEAYNALCHNDVDPSEKLRERVREITGLALKWDEPVDCDLYGAEGGYVELGIKKEGNPAYGDGAYFLIEDLPPGTFAIRVYMA